MMVTSIIIIKMKTSCYNTLLVEYYLSYNNNINIMCIFAYIGSNESREYRRGGDGTQAGDSKTFPTEEGSPSKHFVPAY